MDLRNEAKSFVVWHSISLFRTFFIHSMKSSIKLKTLIKQSSLSDFHFI